MDVSQLFPEEPNEAAPFLGGAAESCDFLERNEYVYVRSCACCGHWFLATGYPLELCIDVVGATIKAYSLNEDEPAFAQMILPARPGKRWQYIMWFVGNLGRAWEYVAIHGHTFTVAYAQAPGHNASEMEPPF